MISVLYIDDEVALLDITRIFLEKIGDFRVDTASSAQIALEKLKTTSCDAIVSDYQMPEMDGIELLKAVRAAYPALPFIIFTGKGREEIAIQAFDSGADFYLQKGGDPKSQYAELAHKIRRAVERRQSQVSLLEEKRLFGDVIDSLPVAVYARDKGGRYIVWNRKSEELFGLPLKDVLQKTASDLFPEDQAVFSREKDAGIIASGAMEDIPVEPVDLASGERRYLHTQMVPLFDADGVPFAILGISEDITEKIGTDAVLRLTEDRYRRLFEEAQDGILILDADTLEIIDANPFVLSLLGVEPEQLLGRHLGEIGLLKDSVLEQEFLAGLMRDGHVRYTDQVLERLDGARIYVEVICNRHQVDNHNIIQCNIRDISERKKDEERIRESEQNFRAFFETSRDCAFITSKEGRWLDLNDAAVKLFGYDSKDELRKVPIPELYKNSDVRTEHMKYIEQEGFSLNYPVDLKKKDGSIIHTQITSVPRKDEQGAVIGFQGIIRDVTEQKRAEEALKVALVKYRTIFDSFPLGITISDEAGNIIESNPLADTLLGLSKEEQLGRQIDGFEWTIVRPDGTLMPPEEFASVRALKEKQVISNVEMGIVKGENEITWINVTAAPIPLDGYGVAITYGDITERTKMGDALVLAMKKINLLSSITRHDIVNQVTVLSTALELISNSTSDPEILELVDTSRKSALRIERQISFTREYQDLGVKAPQWQNVRQTFLDAAGSLDTADIRIEIPENDLEIYADPLLYKVFYNLIDNALRYAAPFSSISLRYQEFENRLVISVADDGAGISPEDKKHLFERGFGRNTGLGLFLSREILAITGIAIAETSAPGEGARFEMTVPEGGYRFTTVFED
jgi:PAS domain S-box-containing protein